jgi:SAM-dependent methyltransferase
MSNLREMERSREAYWQSHGGTSPTKLRWRALTVRHAFHLTPGDSILELGAGSGLWTAHLTDVLRGENPITAAVLNDDLADLASAKDLQNVTVTRLDNLSKDLAPESFDYIVGTAILCHDEYGDNLRALHRLLKPGGQILFFEANFWNPQVLVKSLVPFVGRLAGNAPSQIGMRKYRLLQETSRQGFTNVEIIPYDIVHARTPPRLIPAIQAAAYLLERLPAVRELCGTLYIWARKPGTATRGPRRSLARHPELFGSTSVVVPCHNEADTIPDLVAALCGTYGEYIHEIILVDDSSDDDTTAVAEELARQDPRVKVLTRQPPPGVGRALRDGYAAATGRYVLSMDCDFVAIVPELRDLFDVIASGKDGAIGSRFSHDSILVNYPLGKILANRGFHVLLRLATRLPVHDISNNLKLYRRPILDDLEIVEDGFAANAEVGVAPYLDGYDVDEIPISWVERTPEMGRTSFRIWRAAPGYWRVLVRCTQHVRKARSAAGRRRRESSFD